MAKPFLLIDIFVSQINSSGKGSVSVNHSNLSVIPVILGEVLEEREANKQNEVVAAQLASVFSLSAEDFSKIILAYEPVWAIGTGKTATAEQAREIHAFIRSLIAEK